MARDINHAPYMPGGLIDEPLLSTGEPTKDGPAENIHGSISAGPSQLHSAAPEAILGSQECPNPRIQALRADGELPCGPGPGSGTFGELGAGNEFHLAMLGVAAHGRSSEEEDGPQELPTQRIEAPGAGDGCCGGLGPGGWPSEEVGAGTGFGLAMVGAGGHGGPPAALEVGDGPQELPTQRIEAPGAGDGSSSGLRPGEDAVSDQKPHRKKRRKKSLERRRKKSSYNFVEAKQHLGLSHSANFQQVYSAVAATSRHADAVDDDVSDAPAPYSPPKYVVKRQLRKKSAALERAKEINEKQQSQVKEECENRKAVAEDLKKEKRSHDETKTKMSADRKQLRKQLQERQGELVREQRQKMKDHTLMMEKEMTELRQEQKDELKERDMAHRREQNNLKRQITDIQKGHEKVMTRKERQVEKLKRDTEQMSKLNAVVMELKCKLFAKHEECDELEKELQREKRASRMAITNAMEDAETLMNKASSLTKATQEKEKELKIMTKATVKEYLNEERRRSSRQKARGEFVLRILVQ